MTRQHRFSDRVADSRAESAGAGGGGLVAVDSRRIPPPPAVAWLGAREARDGDGGCGGRADAGRALREAGPGAAEATSGQRGAGRPGTPRGGVSGAASGRRGRPVAGEAGRAARRAVPCEQARHRRRPVPKCGEKSEAEPGRGWNREREEAKAASTPPSRRAPRDRRVRAPPSDHAFRNAAPWEPGAGRAGATASLLAQVEPLKPDAPAVAVAAGGVEEALPRRPELRREARKAERLRRLRPDDLERQRHGDGLDGLLADGTVHGAARPRGRGPCNALPAAAGRGRGGLAR